MFASVNPQSAPKVPTAPKALKAALAPQAHDFAPDLLTVQLSPPSRMPRTVLLGLTALVGCLLVWSFVALAVFCALLKMILISNIHIIEDLINLVILIRLLHIHSRLEKG